MTYGHLQADCLYTGISSGPNARYRVWEAFTFTFTTILLSTATILRQLYRTTCVSRHPQSRTGGFCWSKVLLPACPYIRITENWQKMLEFSSTVLPAPSPESIPSSVSIQQQYYYYPCHRLHRRGNILTRVCLSVCLIVIRTFALRMNRRRGDGS